jgi:hypothetical protein
VIEILDLDAENYRGRLLGSVEIGITFGQASERLPGLVRPTKASA